MTIESTLTKIADQLERIANSLDAKPAVQSAPAETNQRYEAPVKAAVESKVTKVSERETQVTFGAEPPKVPAPKPEAPKAPAPKPPAAPVTVEPAVTPDMINAELQEAWRRNGQSMDKIQTLMMEFSIQSLKDLNPKRYAEFYQRAKGL